MGGVESNLVAGEREREILHQRNDTCSAELTGTAPRGSLGGRKTDTERKKTLRRNVGNREDSVAFPLLCFMFFGMWGQHKGGAITPPGVSVIMHYHSRLNVSLIPVFQWHHKWVVPPRKKADYFQTACPTHTWWHNIRAHLFFYRKSGGSGWWAHVGRGRDGTLVKLKRGGTRKVSSITLYPADDLLSLQSPLPHIQQNTHTKVTEAVINLLQFKSRVTFRPQELVGI